MKHLDSLILTLKEQIMQNDFLKFAVAQGLNSMHVEKTMEASAHQATISDNYISPSILEERQLNVTQMDVFSRLMMDRIIFLGTEIRLPRYKCLQVYWSLKLSKSVCKP